MPACSISLPTPVHKHIDPARDRARVIPPWAPWSTPDASSLPRPDRNPQRIETVKIPVHIQLMTILTSPLVNNMHRIRGKYCIFSPKFAKN
jgi:hypothetical protein